MVSFLVGINTANENEIIHLAEAEEFVSVVITLEYTPRDGGEPRPLVFSNTSSTKPVKLQEIHDSSLVLPLRSSDGCQKTNSAGRCTVANVPVGGEGGEGEKQYDIFLADASFFETLTGIPLETPLPSISFNSKKCAGSDKDNVFTNDPREREQGWCLTRQKDGSPYPEYFVTLTLSERDICLKSTPPPTSCTGDGKIIQYMCDPDYRGTTAPWKPLEPAWCGDYIECPDGNSVHPVCLLLDGSAACSQALACSDHQLCDVHSFPTPPPVLAGEDEIVFTGKYFGNKGGVVSFARVDKDGKPTQDREDLHVPAGPSWTDTRIRVRVPYVAGEGKLRIIPEGYQTVSVKAGVEEQPFCESPTLYVSRPEDQPSIVVARIVSSPHGTVAPGYVTTIEVLGRHPKGIDKLYAIDVELLEGTFPSATDIPLQRPTLAYVQCDLRQQYPPVKTVTETTFRCSIPIPENLASHGPFTYLVRLSGGSVEANSLITSPTPEENPNSSALRSTFRMLAVIPVAGNAKLAGDFNGNGLHDAEDAAIASRIVRGALPPTSAHLLHDTDGDGRISRSDLISVLHFLTQE